MLGIVTGESWNPQAGRSLWARRSWRSVGAALSRYGNALAVFAVVAGRAGRSLRPDCALYALCAGWSGSARDDEGCFVVGGRQHQERAAQRAANGVDAAQSVLGGVDVSVAGHYTSPDSFTRVKLTYLGTANVLPASVKRTGTRLTGTAQKMKP